MTSRPEINGVHRLTDVIKSSDGAAAIYRHAIREIVIAEEVKGYKEWKPNLDVEYSLRHAIGHVTDCCLLKLDQRISDQPSFRNTVANDISAMPSEFRDCLTIDSDQDSAWLHEIFALLYARIMGIESSFTFQSLLQNLFPETFFYMSGQNQGERKYSKEEFKIPRLFSEEFLADLRKEASLPKRRIKDVANKNPWGLKIAFLCDDGGIEVSTFQQIGQTYFDGTYKAEPGTTEYESILRHNRELKTGIPHAIPIYPATVIPIFPFGSSFRRV
jgi:hypothetical protein